MTAPTRPFSALDVRLPVIEADITLHALLAAPPLGHTPTPQPDAWYDAVFAEMACAHPENCPCPPEEASK